jgi:hypothetical protein
VQNADLLDRGSSTLPGAAIAQLTSHHEELAGMAHTALLHVCTLLHHVWQAATHRFGDARETKGANTSFEDYRADNLQSFEGSSARSRR